MSNRVTFCQLFDRQLSSKEGVEPFYSLIRSSISLWFLMELIFYHPFQIVFPTVGPAQYILTRRPG